MPTTNRENTLEQCALLDTQGKYDQALQLVSDAIASDSDELAYLMCRGRLLADRLGRVGEAIDDFEKAMAIDENSATPHQHLSLCYLLLNDAETATVHAEKAVELANADAVSHSCLARCRVHSKRFHSAMKHFEIALQLDQHSADNWSGLAEACRGAGLLEKAEQAYERAALLNPKASHYLQLGTIKIDLGKNAEAIKALEAAQRHELSEVEHALVHGYLEVAKQK